MGKVVEKKKKKKGRPSLLDLQKRTLKEQQQQQQQQLQQTNKNHNHKHPSNSVQNFTSNYNSTTSTPLRRSTRRNPNPSPERALSDDEDDEDDELAGNRREKKLKLVLKLQKSSSRNSNSNASDSDENAAFNHRKRKINAIGGGSASVNYEKGEKSISGINPTHNNQGALLESGPSTPLPDKKLLLFILDRLQKKDTYGVFSEPVDPKELPDYHEVIEHPMDFATLRNKLSNGAYSSLEEFEKDVFLICSNAMQYNAPDTIYFRQARSIQELAKKNFENLRQDSDDNQTEPKVVRRGRPPTKNWKKPPGRPPLERARSEFSSDATLATGLENTVWAAHDLRKGPPNSDKSGFADSSGRFYSSRNDVLTGLLADNRFERNDEVSMSKGYLTKHGKRQFVADENRRNTYKQDHQSAGGREVSVLTTFDAERKQLLAVGVHSEHGYTRSLSRFAANLGPLAWKIASKRIERCLPAGTKFGPGWVGENDVTPSRPLLVPSPPSGVQSTSSKPFFILENLCSAATTTVESKGDKLTEKPVGEDLSDKHVPSTLPASEGHLKKPSPTSALHSSSLFATIRSSEPCTQRPEVVAGSNSHTGVNILNTTVGSNDTRPPIQIHQRSIIHPGMNGINGTHGFNLPAQMWKLIGAARSGEFSLQPSQMLDRVSRTNTNFVHPVNASNLNSDSKLADISGKVNYSKSLPNSECDSLAAFTPGRGPPTWQGLSPQPKPDSGLSPHPKPDSGLSPQQKSDSVPPDLNVRFHSPGSPSSSRVDSTQPDLALQL